MVDTGGVTGERLKSLIERVERLEEEKAALAEDIREVDLVTAITHKVDVAAVDRLQRVVELFSISIRLGPVRERTTKLASSVMHKLNEGTNKNHGPKCK